MTGHEQTLGNLEVAVVLGERIGVLAQVDGQDHERLSRLTGDEWYGK
jgi:hypothetical protein